MEIDLPQPETMEINEQLATNFSKKLMIQWKQIIVFIIVTYEQSSLN